MGLIDSVDLRRDLNATLPDQLISQIDRVDALRVEDGPVITGITEGRGQYLTAGDADDPLRLLLRFPLAAGRAGPNGVYPDVQLSRHIRADNPAHALRLDRRADDKQLCCDARREQQHHYEGNADAAAQRDGEQVAPQQAIDGFDKIYQQGRFLLYFG